MKRINSNSWKKPYERDIRNSQDSAISSQGMQNSQCLEFSQVSTQDLFGQNMGSQNEQCNQKMSMYEKWLSKRSFAKHNTGESVVPSWTPKSNHSSLRADGQQCAPHVGSGRSSIKITPSSSNGFSMNKLKAEDNDERDLLDQILNRFQENKQEMSTLAVNVKDMLERMGGSFSSETKEFLSSFMEEISKSHDSLVSQIQDMEKEKSREKELEKQLTTKDCQIASLGTKLTALEEQINSTKGEDINCIAKRLQEEMKSNQILLMRKLDEITENLGNQKEYVSECKHNIDELKDDFALVGKEMHKDVQVTEARVLKELKKLPKDIKNAINIKSEVLACIEGIPAEMEHSMKTSLEVFSKDIKTAFSKEQKKLDEQILRKQFDRIFQKMDALVDEHKKIQQFMEANEPDTFKHQLEGISEHMKQLKNKSPSNSFQIKQLEKSMAHHQEEHSQHLQNIIVQQKEFLDKIDSISKTNTKAKQCMDNTSGHEGFSNHSPDGRPIIQKPVFSGGVMNKSFALRKSNELMERNYNMGPEIDCCYNESSSNGYPTPSKKIIHQVENKVNNISMPVINQTNIYSSRMQHKFKSPLPLCSLANTHDFIQSNQHSQVAETTNRWGERQDHEKRMPFISPFKRPETIMTYSKRGPSPIAAVKPQKHNIDDGQCTVNRIKHKETLHFNNNFINVSNDSSTSRSQLVSKPEDKQEQQTYHHPKHENNQEENKYWLRKRNHQLYHENILYVRQTPKRSKNVRKPLDSAQTKLSCISGKRQFLHKDQENSRDGVSKRKHDTSIYDFEDDNVSISSGQLMRAKAPPCQMDYGVSTPKSSPALTIRFDWTRTPSVVRKNQRILINPDCSQMKQTRKRNYEDETLLSDMNFWK